MGVRPPTGAINSPALASYEIMPSPCKEERGTAGARPPCPPEARSAKDTHKISKPALAGEKAARRGVNEEEKGRQERRRRVDDGRQAVARAHGFERRGSTEGWRRRRRAPILAERVRDDVRVDRARVERLVSPRADRTPAQQQEFPLELTEFLERGLCHPLGSSRGRCCWAQETEILLPYAPHSITRGRWAAPAWRRLGAGWPVSTRAIFRAGASRV